MHATKTTTVQKSKYFGVLFLLLFGMAWLIAPLAGGHHGYTQAALLLLLAELAFLTKVWVRWRAMPGQKVGRNEAVNRKFAAIMRYELVGIVAAIFICKALHVSNATGAAITLVVGAHFLPLAKLFRLPLYNLLAVLLMIAGGVCFILIGLYPHSLLAQYSVDFAVSTILGFIAVLSVSKKLPSKFS